MACSAPLPVSSAESHDLQSGSAAPGHTHPPQEPEDALEESLDAPCVLQPPRAGDPNGSWCKFQFFSADFSGSGTGSVYIKRYFLGMIRGPDIRLFMLTTTESRYLNHTRFPYHTKTEDCFIGIEVISGRVTKYIICNCVEVAINVPREDYVHTFIEATCTYLFVGPDGQVDGDTYTQEHDYHAPYDDSESEADYEEHEEILTPEEMEVPFISYHLAGRGVTDIDLKLSALRQAFSTVLASIHNQNFLFVEGKKIVMHLAAANNQDVDGVQLAYESLIQFLRRPSNQDSIVSELLEAQLHHYNFLDVFFDLLLFEYFTYGSAPEAPEGGFLDRLFALVAMWDVDVWEPAARQCFTELIDKLTDLSEALFSQDMELYSDPAALASTVLHLLKQHVQLMMDTLERL